MVACKIKYVDAKDLNLRNEFPMLDDGKVYLDSASTSFKPKSVIARINKYLKTEESNYNRGANNLVMHINNEGESVRDKVAKFIDAESCHITFTSGATASSKIIASTCALNNLTNGDKILLCDTDHYSTINPWKKTAELLKKFNVNVKIEEILVDIYGNYLKDDLISKIDDKTKYVILTHIHNVTGVYNDISNLISIIKKKNENVKIVLDASQSIGHFKVSVKELDVDYLYFSGHKMFATTGIGVLYTKDEIYKDFEEGTPNVLGIISLGAAIDFINSIGIENIDNYLYNLTMYLYENLLEIDDIEFNKGTMVYACKSCYGIISFRHRKISSEEINEILNAYQIYIRSNNFCQKGQDEFIRVSLHIYNNREDIDKFIKVLKSIIEV